MVDVFFHEREQVFRDKKLDKDLIVVSNVNDLKLKIDKEFGMKPYAISSFFLSFSFKCYLVYILS